MALSSYKVEGTLKIQTYGYGSSNYECEVVAANSKEAISKARQEVRRMGYDRHDGPITFKATKV